jgi:hypothetical protein
MRAYNLIISSINNLRRIAGRKSEVLPVEQPRTAAGRWESVELDADEITRLANDGWSCRRIAKKLGVHHSTISARLRQLESPMPIEPTPGPIAATPTDRHQEPSGAAPEAPVQAPEAAAMVLILPALLDAPRAAQSAPAPISKPAPAQEPRWWTELPDDRRKHLSLEGDAYSHIFLTDDAYACERAWGYASPCIAFDSWHASYGQHPVIAEAEKFWVCSRSLKFLRSLQLSPIRERCLVLVDRTAYDAAQWRLQLHRERQDDGFFERCLAVGNGLRPIPELPAKIDDLVPPPELKPDVPTDYSWQPAWRLGGSAGSR